MAGSLDGKRILVTRAAEQAEAFSRKIKSHGGESFEVPVIAFRQPVDSSYIEKTLQHLQDYRWIIFTSANGVRFFFQNLRRIGLDYPVKANTAVVGQKTLRILQKYGIDAEVVPEEFVAESLLERLQSEVQPGDSVLMPRGNLARKKLPKELALLGANVTDLVVYETIANRDNEEALNQLLMERRIDVVAFTSSSTVRFYSQLLRANSGGKCMDTIKIACIGPITAKSAHEQGFKPDMIAKEYTVEGLLNAIEQYFREGIS